MAKKKVETHVINKKKSTQKSKRSEIIYTITGKQDYLDDDIYPCIKMDSKKAQESPNAFAMKITIGARVALLYWVSLCGCFSCCALITFFSL